MSGIVPLRDDVAVVIGGAGPPNAVKQQVAVDRARFDGAVEFVEDRE